MDDTCFNRRELLKAAVATAAYGFAGEPTAVRAADESSSARTTVTAIVDTHVYIGRWPHAYLPHDEPETLIAELKRHNIEQAWVGSFDGIFHKDIGSANERLAAACAEFGNGMLMPFGSVNPTLPDWQEEIRRCHEDFLMRGVRLHPTYHGYALDDPRLAELLKIATDSNLVVQLVAWLEDVPRKWLNPRADLFDLKQPSEFWKKSPNLRILISGLSSGSLLENKLWTSINENISFDISRFASSPQLDTVLAAIPASRLAFGSAAPLRSVDSLSHLQSAKLSPDQLQAIARGSAIKLLGKPS